MLVYAYMCVYVYVYVCMCIVIWTSRGMFCEPCARAGAGGRGGGARRRTQQEQRSAQREGMIDDVCILMSICTIIVSNICLMFIYMCVC